jgi:tetratricopeptide (TPR) repeat protein
MSRSRFASSGFTSNGSARRANFLRGLAGLAVLALAACETPPAAPRIAFTGDPIVDGNAMLASAPPADRVMWDYRLAASALRAGKLDEAKQKLDDAIARIGGIIANDEAAKRARGYFSEERSKTFIGEPYERVMAYYYRGLLYWRDGEIDNARACFRSAQLIDSVAESENYQSDYVLLDYLDGLASAKLHDDPADAFARAEKNAKHPLPPYDAGVNTLLFLEWGEGPQKYAGGRYGEELRFRVAPSRVRSATLTTAGKTVYFTAWDNLNFQAVTRGGRVMDFILNNKAVFKQTTDTVGDAALIGAAIAADNIYKDKDREPPRPRRRGTNEPEPKEPPKPEKNYDAENTAIALGVVGIFSKIASAATTPQADTRQWNNLPQYLSFGSMKLPPGEHPAIVQFFDAEGHVVENLTRRITLTIPGDQTRDTVVILSEHKF